MSARNLRIMATAGIALVLTGAYPYMAAGVTAPSFKLPHVNAPKPDKLAVFDVDIEGNAFDDNQSSLTGSTAVCIVALDGNVHEKTTYLRGKDVKMEFAKYGHNVIVQRKGRIGDSSLALQANTTRTASRGTVYSDLVPPVPCGVPGYDLNSNQDCGKTFVRPTDFNMIYKSGKIGLELTSTQSILPQDKCGTDPTTGEPDTLLWHWPEAPTLDPAELSSRQIFDSKHGFTLHLTWSPPATSANGVPRNFSGLTMSGSVTGTAGNEATLRFRRLNTERRRPICAASNAPDTIRTCDLRFRSGSGVASQDTLRYPRVIESVPL